MVTYLKRLAVGGGAALAMTALWVPVPVSASAPPVVPGAQSVTVSAAQVQAIEAGFPAPTAAQLAAALAYAKAHPFKGTISPLPAPSGTRVSPDVSTNVYWWGVRIHLTRDDVHNIWDLVVVGGISGAAAILCGPGVWLALVCGLIGAVVGYIVAEAVWYYIGYNVPSCGVHIDIPWTLQWSWGNC